MREGSRGETVTQEMRGKDGMKVDAGMGWGWLEASGGRRQEYTRRIARDAKIRLHAAEAGILIMSTNAAHSILPG